MTTNRPLATLFVLLGSVLPLGAAISESQGNTIDRITGAKGGYTENEDVYRVTFPRTDVKMTVEGRAMHPFQGLTSWASFTPDAQGGFMVMGDLVLFEDEVNTAMSAALDRILGVKGLSNPGMYKTLVVRETSMHGKSVGSQMGVNTWAVFAGSDEGAVVDGDFAMLESEVQPALRALRKAGINIVAIHNHMTHEEPRYMFLHYWGKGPAAALARGLKSALDAQQAAQTAQVVLVCEHGAAVETPHHLHASSKRREWNDTPTVSAIYSAARDSIRARIQPLIDELSAKAGK